MCSPSSVALKTPGSAKRVNCTRGLRRTSNEAQATIVRRRRIRFVVVYGDDITVAGVEQGRVKSAIVVCPVETTFATPSQGRAGSESEGKKSGAGEHYGCDGEDEGGKERHREIGGGAASLL